MTTLLIIFAVGFAVYLVGGFLYNMKIKELRGIEAIPNVEFWRDFPNLVMVRPPPPLLLRSGLGPRHAGLPPGMHSSRWVVLLGRSLGPVSPRPPAGRMQVHVYPGAGTSRSLRRRRRVGWRRRVLGGQHDFHLFEQLLTMQPTPLCLLCPFLCLLESFGNSESRGTLPRLVSI